MYSHIEIVLGKSMKVWGLLLVTGLLAFVSLPSQADMNTYLKLKDQAAQRGMESLPNHPRACGEGDNCFHNVDRDSTFRKKAQSLARDNPDVTAEDIIRCSGWEPYLDHKVLLMNEYFYAYSTCGKPIFFEQARADDEQEPETPEAHVSDIQDEKPWWQFWGD